ncbi:MAG: ATP-binding protein [Saprospiraceae bacterium]|nr:ATP-binding protein [Saprospiraceae bacterium]
MKIPFVFGKPALEENFADRKEEIHQIVQNFKSLSNTILISPRGWGKSSLMKKAAEISIKTEHDLKFCFVSLNGIKNEEEFYNTVAKELLRIVSTEFEVIRGIAKKYLGKIFLKIKLISDSTNEFSLLLDMEETNKFPEEILNLAENIAIENNKRIIVCIEDFQNISGFADTISFQQKLKSVWQSHKNAAYCLSGSNRFILSELFETQEMPLYGFGDIILLEKIKTEEWIPFLIGRFVNTGKSIDKNSAELIVRLAENHPQYVQILAQQSWLRSPYICNEQIIGDAYESILLQKSLLFQNITARLSDTQVYFLNALISGTDKFNSQKVLLKYKLGTSGNITKIKKALVEKEIIDIQSGKISFLDPFYKAWLAKYYFLEYTNEFSA